MYIKHLRISVLKFELGKYNDQDKKLSNKLSSQHVPLHR